MDLQNYQTVQQGGKHMNYLKQISNIWYNVVL